MASHELHDRLSYAARHFNQPTNRAICAVVELHAPQQLHEGGYLTCACGSDGYMSQGGAPWPCATIQAIARELGVEIA